MASKSVQKSGKAKSNDEIFAGFQSLRNEQRQLGSKISELEMDLNEHKIVIDTLKQVSPERKCFRMIGGVLVERTVQDVVPELETNCDQLPRVISSLTEQLTRKGTDINQYIETHNIRFQKTEELVQATERDDAKPNVLVPTN